jgi:hypothetical protein
MLNGSSRNSETGIDNEWGPCFVIRICVLSARKGIVRPSLRPHLVLMSTEREDSDIVAGGRSRYFALMLGGKC